MFTQIKLFCKKTLTLTFHKAIVSAPQKYLET